MNIRIRREIMRALGRMPSGMPMREGALINEVELCVCPVTTRAVILHQVKLLEEEGFILGGVNGFSGEVFWQLTVKGTMVE